jgi:REP element-mobilizing transposase RayT
MNRFSIRKKIRLPLPVYNRGHAFFITISTFQKYPWFGKHSCLCETAIKLIRDLFAVNGDNVYAWCIMPDHVHLLIHGNDIIELVRLFKGKMTPVARSLEPDRRLWQRSFYDHALRREESLSEIAGYIWENPVRAGIVEKPDDYSWSGSEVWPNWDRYYL